VKLIEIHRNVISGQCFGALIRIQVGYSAIFLGCGFLPKDWSGLQWGIFAPMKTESGYVRKGFYGSLLPGIAGPPAFAWPRWYHKLWLGARFKIACDY
jgi:hypothetical protein